MVNGSLLKNFTLIGTSDFTDRIIFPIEMIAEVVHDAKLSIKGPVFKGIPTQQLGVSFCLIMYAHTENLQGCFCINK